MFPLIKFTLPKFQCNIHTYICMFLSPKSFQVHNNNNSTLFTITAALFTCICAHIVTCVCVHTAQKKQSKENAIEAQSAMHWTPSTLAPKARHTNTRITHTHTYTHTGKQLAWSHFSRVVAHKQRITDNRHTHRHTRTYNTCSSQPLRAKRKSVTFSAHAISLAQQSRLLHVTYQAAFVACCAPIELTSHDAKFAERMYIFHI